MLRLSQKKDTLLSTSKNSATNSSTSWSVKGTCTMKVKMELFVQDWQVLNLHKV
jgi:hypothetical protein